MNTESLQDQAQQDQTAQEQGTTPPKIRPKPFSIDHLLLGGFIYDIGQLSIDQQKELDLRWRRGELNKYFIPYPQREVTREFRMVSAWAHPNWEGQHGFVNYNVRSFLRRSS